MKRLVLDRCRHKHTYAPSLVSFGGFQFFKATQSVSRENIAFSLLVWQKKSIKKNLLYLEFYFMITNQTVLQGRTLHSSGNAKYFLDVLFGLKPGRHRIIWAPIKCLFWVEINMLKPCCEFPIWNTSYMYLLNIWPMGILAELMFVAFWVCAAHFYSSKAEFVQFYGNVPQFLFTSLLRFSISSVI